MSWQIFSDGTRIDYDGDAPEPDDEQPDEPGDDPEPMTSPGRESPRR